MGSSETLDEAVRLHQGGQLTSAIALYEQLLATSPQFAELWHLLGVAQFQLGHADIALEHIRRALSLKPGFAEAHANVGMILQRQGRHAEALAAYHRSLALEPNVAATHNNLGNAWLEQGNIPAAIACYEQAISLQHNYPEAHHNLGTALLESKRPEAAADCYRRALSLNPDYDDAHYGLGVAFMELVDTAAARASLERALELNPGHPKAHNNLGTLLFHQGDYAGAERLYRKSIQLAPTWAAAHWNLSTLHLLRGEFASGWPLFEWRWKTGQLQQRHEDSPRWQGQSLTGQTLLLHAEQGLGDTLQFVRYAQVLKNLGARVLLECQPPLTRLLQGASEIDFVMAAEPFPPPFDYQIPLLSLPAVLKTSLTTIPQNVPYLNADQSLVELWKNRLRHLTGCRIGINWHGRPGRGFFRQRDIPLAFFEQLANVPGVHLISLQKPSGTETDDMPGDHSSIVEFSDLDTANGPFMDTAALMKSLDLVITSDTAVAHLAGALAIPTWLALPYVPDWRWLLDRTDSPWYPTMRLFRQPSAGDWATVFDEVRSALKGFRSSDFKGTLGAH